MSGGSASRRLVTTSRAAPARASWYTRRWPTARIQVARRSDHRCCIRAASPVRELRAACAVPRAAQCSGGQADQMAERRTDGSYHLRPPPAVST